jgi:hypothetical protein
MRALILVFTLAPSLAAQSPAPPKVAEVLPSVPTKPEEFTARVGQLKRLSSADPKAKWELAAGTAGAELLSDGKGGCVFSAERAGRYTLVCYLDGPCQWVTIVVGDAAPNPSPTPPKPEPTPKPEVDSVAESIREAYARDTGKPYEKKQWAAALAGVWLAGVKHASNDRVATAGQLVTQIRGVVGNELKPEQLAETRKAIGADLAKLFGNPDANLTPEMRTDAAKLFAKFAKTLEEIAQ